MNKCIIKNCGKETRYKNYCHRHYRQIWLKGKIYNTGHNRLNPNEFEIIGSHCFISLYNRKGETIAKAIIDADDYEKCRNIRWSIKHHNYVRSERFKCYLHRFIMNVEDPNIYIDHINGNRLDNRSSNLRTCTPAESSKNIRKHSQNLSGYKGVQRSRNKWTARIMSDGENIYIGSFDTKEKAAEAYNKYAAKKHGEFAKFNNLSSDLAIY